MEDEREETEVAAEAGELVEETEAPAEAEGPVEDLEEEEGLVEDSEIVAEAEGHEDLGDETRAGQALPEEAGAVETTEAERDHDTEEEEGENGARDPAEGSEEEAAGASDRDDCEEEEESYEDFSTSRSRSRSRGEPDPEAGARDDPDEDYWEVRPAQGCVIRHHVRKRRHLYVPQHEPEIPFAVEQLRPERRTRFWSTRQSMVVIDDDWRAEGGVNPGYGLWVGTTAFTMRGRDLAWGPGGGYGRSGRPSGGAAGSAGDGGDDDESGVDSPLLWLDQYCMAMARVEGELEDQVIASRRLAQKASRKAHEEGQRLSEGCRIGQRSG